MDPNIIPKKWIQGMTVKPDSLLGQTFTGEESAHVFRITGETTGGAAVPITGTIAAKFLRSDNITVPLSGSVSDGVAVVTLTDECYLVPGRFIFSIYVTQGDLCMCIYCGVGNVFRTDSGEYEGGEIITDVTALMNAIETAVASIPADYSTLLAAIAPTFSASTAYPAGSYVWYDGNLYKFTADHSAGSWTGTDVAAANLGGDVADLKSALEYHGESIEADLAAISDTQRSDNLADISKMTDWPSDNAYATTDFIPAKKDDVVYSTSKNGSTYYGLNNAKIYAVEEYDYALTRLERAVGFTNSYVVQNENTKYVRITVNKAYYSTGRVWSLTINSYPATAAEITEYSKSITALDSVARQHASDIENSLAKYVLLKPQDGINKALGLEISDLNVFNPYADGVVLGKRVNGSGGLLTSETWFTSDFIPCDGKTTVYMSQVNNGTFINVTSTNFNHIEQYDSNKAFISGTYQTYTNTVTLNANAKYIRFSNAKTQLEDVLAGTRVIFVNFDTVPTAAMVEEYYTSIMAKQSSLDALTVNVDANTAKVAGIPLITSDNKYDETKITTSHTINYAGEVVSGAGNFVTDFIPAQKGDVLWFGGINSSDVFGVYGYSFVKIAEYAADKTTVTAVSENYRNPYQTTGTGTAYVRIAFADAVLSFHAVMIAINEKPTIATMSEYAAAYYDANGISENTKRSRKVLWLGTSIPTYGYPQLLGRAAGATVYNEAIGESCIAKGKASLITTANICGVRKLGGLYSLTQTRAEKETLIANWSTIASEISATATLTDDQKRICRMSSYEIILDPYLTGEDPTAVNFDAAIANPVGTLVKYDGKLYVLRGDHAAGAAWSWSTASGAKPLDVPHAPKANLIVLNHGYNDQSGDLLAPENDPYNVYTLEGAYNWTIKHILDKVPDMPIVIFGHYTDFSYPDADQALINVSKRWNIPYYKLGDDLEWGTQTINTAKKVNANGAWETITAADMTVLSMWLGDGVHPVGVSSQRIAKVASPTMKNWVQMWL